MPKDFDTNKGPEDFEDKKSFIDYCVEVAKYIYKVFIGEDNINGQ